MVSQGSAVRRLLLCGLLAAAVATDAALSMHVGGETAAAPDDAISFVDAAAAGAGRQFAFTGGTVSFNSTLITAVSAIIGALILGSLLYIAYASSLGASGGGGGGYGGGYGKRFRREDALGTSKGIPPPPPQSGLPSLCPLSLSLYVYSLLFFSVYSFNAAVRRWAARRRRRSSSPPPLS